MYVKKGIKLLLASLSQKCCRHRHGGIDILNLKSRVSFPSSHLSHSRADVNTNTTTNELKKEANNNLRGDGPLFANIRAPCSLCLRCQQHIDGHWPSERCISHFWSVSLAYVVLVLMKPSMRIGKVRHALVHRLLGFSLQCTNKLFLTYRWTKY